MYRNNEDKSTAASRAAAPERPAAATARGPAEATGCGPLRGPAANGLAERPAAGSLAEIVIEDTSAEGSGIGKADGFAVFVKGAVPGDKVLAELTKVKKSYAVGRLVEILEPSPHRRRPQCPLWQSCGGCAYQQLAYEEQLALKRRQVRDKLVRLGGLKDPKVNETVGMEQPCAYRNKASMAVSTGGFMTKKGGQAVPCHEPRIGFRGAGSHEVTDCGSCMLQAPPAMEAAKALRRFMAEDNITSYDSRWKKGLMRHMVVRTAFGTGEVMVILVINGRGIPNAAKLVKMLDTAIAEIPVSREGPLAGVEFSLESVIINVNKKENSPLMGEECITLAGKPTITEELLGLSFEISPQAFYQVNPRQTEALYRKALEYAALRGGETVLDLYCGVGTIGLFAAEEMRRAGAAGDPAGANTGSASAAASGPDGGTVVGIEAVKAAVIDANRNAVINGIVNARYVCGKAEDELPKLGLDGADVAILDPPRAGCDRRLLEALAELRPKRVVYVSCDAATLARDIKLLREMGYEFVEATPVDMFPWTAETEVAALLTART